MGRGGYQMARLTKPQREERDRLVQQILDAARSLYDQRLLRQADLVVEQDEMGQGSASSSRVTDTTFYAAHPTRDVRVNVVLVVRAPDR